MSVLAMDPPWRLLGQQWQFFMCMKLLVRLLCYFRVIWFARRALETLTLKTYSNSLFYKRFKGTLRTVRSYSLKQLS